MNQVAELLGHDGSINCVRFTNDGKYCMTCSEDKSLMLFNPHRVDAHGRALSIKTYAGVHGYGVLGVSITDDHNRFASVGYDRSAFLWDVSTGNVIRRFQGHTQRINAVALNGEGSIMVTASYDKTVRIWDLKNYNGRDPIQILDNARDSVSHVILTDHEIITSSIDGCIRSYDMRKGSLTCDEIHHPVTHIGLSHGGSMYLCASVGGTAQVLDKHTGRSVRQLKGHKHNEYKIECGFLPGDSRAVIGSETGEVWIQSLTQANAVTTHQCHQRCVSTIDIASTSDNQSLIATGSHDGSAKIWRVSEL